MVDEEGNVDISFRNRVLENLSVFKSKLTEIEANGRTSSTEVWHEPRLDKRKIYARIRCNVISVGEIDTVKQQFDAEIFLGVKYKEPELKGLTREDVDWEKMWSPRIVFANAEAIHSLECKHRILDHSDEVEGVPDAYVTYRMKATFKTLMDLVDFPVDFQRLTIKLMSDWPEVDVEFVKDMDIKDSIRMDVFSGCHEWELCPVVAATPIRGTKLHTGSHRVYPKYHLTMYAKRKALYYFWNLALVLMLIVCLSFASFAVSADQPEDRLSVTLTLLLTAVAFKYVAAQALPPISYLTLLDKYVIFCLVFQCTAVCQNAVASAFATPDSRALFDAISAYCMKRRSDHIIQTAVKEYEELNARINKNREVRLAQAKKGNDKQTAEVRSKRGNRLKKNKVHSTQENQESTDKEDIGSS
ncbi:glycine receptor subunit beta-like isoform X2 [Acanthaster planci]|uniref:Glycine receptor subunit beta-like isoform X2 n=1 Tax=Acanthaster planci TaxID=133434 RepID=A0A8B7Y7B2_ACAPL|nr:glycine receptor subunit beta-like isoform X2 [Acanthaster planci]